MVTKAAAEGTDGAPVESRTGQLRLREYEAFDRAVRQLHSILDELRVHSNDWRSKRWELVVSHVEDGLLHAKQGLEETSTGDGP